MITKITHLKNIGKFYDFSAKRPGLNWHKNTFLYAPNAYGKSTLVNVCRSLRDNNPKLVRARKTLGSIGSPEAVITVDGGNHVFNGIKWDKSCLGIRIFDVPFIQANIVSYEIEHEQRKNMHKIIIGAAGVKLSQELSALKMKQKKKRQRFETLRTEFGRGRFVHHALAAFLAIPSTEESAVTARIEELEKDIKSKQTETQVLVLGLPSEIATPAFDLSATKTLASKKLAAAHEAAEKLVLEHIEKNISDKSRAKNFVRQGLDLVQAACPFCGQDLKTATNLLEAYGEFFDDAFRSFQTKLSQTEASLDNWNIENELTALVSSHNENIAIVTQWKPFIGAEVLPDLSAFVETARTKLTASKSKVMSELEKKQKDPNADADLSQFDKMAAELESLKTSVESYNKAVKNFTAKAKHYVDKLPKSDVDTLKVALAKEREIEKRFKAEWKKWATEYPAAKKDADDLLAKKDAKQKELETYTKTIFGTYQKRINDLLVTMGADFTITDLKGKTDERANESYSDFGFLILNKKVPLKPHHDDSPCLKNTLSEGDKSTLAFAFFISSLERTPDLDKQVVILDDPLSSLDQTRREATARVLLELSPKLSQLCVFTHKKDFLRMMFDKIADNIVLQVRWDKTRGSWLEPFNVEEDRKSDYVKIVEAMQRYINEDFGPTPGMMQGNIRKVFETVLETKYYQILAPDIKQKKGLAKLLGTLFDQKLLDATLKAKLFNLCNVANNPHHGEIVDAPSKALMHGEVIPLIHETFDVLKEI